MQPRLLLPLILCFFFLGKELRAQSPGWHWAKEFSGPDSKQSHALATDPVTGDVYFTGYFEDTLDFDPDTSSVFNLISSGSIDIFICKLNSAGNFLWAKAMGGTGFDWANDLAIDGAGNVYITGQFAGTADFDPDSLSFFHITTAGADDIFVVKLNGSGNFIWAKAMGGNAMDFGGAIAIDDVGNAVYITGVFRSTADFDPDPSGTFNLTGGTLPEIFISKLDLAGNFIRAQSVGSADNDWPTDIELDASGNVYITGYFRDTADYDPGAGVFNLISAGDFDIFILKTDSAGNFTWAKAMGGINGQFGYSIAVDGSGNVYTTGGFRTTSDFDPDATGVYNITSAGSLDIFISKLDASGNFVWAKAIGGIGDDRGLCIITDNAGDIYVTGEFRTAPDFDPGAGIFNLTSNGITDIFISRYEASGNFIWAKSAGGIFTENGQSMNLDGAGNIYITGDFSSDSIYFGSTVFTNTGFSDGMFLVKLDTVVISGNNELKIMEQDIQLFPNPATNQFTVYLKNNFEKATVIITDLTGKIIKTTLSTEIQKITVNTEDISSGIYLVQIRSENFIETKKIIVVK